MPRKILLCDDEAHILRAAEIKFKRAGYEVLLASDGEEAWQIIVSERPEILVTDCQMPLLNGLQLADRIRQTPETAHLPVILLSAKGFELSTDEICRQFGLRAILSKPFSPRELFQRVEAELAAIQSALAGI